MAERSSRSVSTWNSSSAPRRSSRRYPLSVVIFPDVTGLDTDKDANEFPALVSDLGAGMDGEVDLGVARRREPIHRGRRVQRGTVSHTGDRPDCRARGGHPPDGRVHGIVIRPPR